MITKMIIENIIEQIMRTKLRTSLSNIVRPLLGSLVIFAMRLKTVLSLVDITTPIPLLEIQ